MIMVIQCAATKTAGAGHLRNRRGQPIFFVADPSRAPALADGVYARPDDVSDQGPSWRELVLRYNQETRDNPFGLLPAIALYDNPAYRRLADAFGDKCVYVLSAGWGLIAADFLTPAYDITFSASADPYKRRMRTNRYRDICMLPDRGEAMSFIGGKDYVPLFVKLTQGMRGPRTVFYNSVKPPEAPGCALERFQTTTRTNWHYECARELAAHGIRQA